MLQEARHNKKQPPYVYRYFNVETRYPSPMGLNRSVLSRVLNCFIDILNQKPHLPRYVLVIIDKDWFETSGMVEYGAGDACNTAIQWWIREFYKSVEVRKDHLYNKKPGALAIGSEPRFIWVAMIK